MRQVSDLSRSRNLAARPFRQSHRGRLTDDDLDMINGRRDQLEGKIQDRYGLAKDQVQKDVDDWYTAQRW
jgi:uncharacterized protein YjbJ (UPF0337 family)